MLSKFTHRFALPLLVAALVAGAAGCGSDDDDGGEPEAPAPKEDVSPGPEPQGKVKPLDPPKSKESIDEASERFADVIESGDCDEIVALGALSRKTADEEARCKLFEARLAEAEAAGSEAYGDGGGVIDYEASGREFSAVLVLDQDGLYHLAYFDVFLGEPSVGTEQAKEFDDAADEAVEALQERDCDAVLAVSHSRLGPGALDEDAACTFVENNPIAGIFEVYPEAELESLGGNASYAFYGLAGPGSYQVLVMARQSDDQLPEGAEPLPKGAPEYAFAGVFRTRVKSPDGAE